MRRQTPRDSCRLARQVTSEPSPVLPGERYFAVDVAPRIRPSGHPGDEHRRFWLAVGRHTATRFAAAVSQGLDRGIWFVNHMIFEAKMMTIFSMLFGAGLVLMDQRAEARGARIRWVYYRRIFWLLVIGLVHAYLIWDGDILVLYAETGLFLYFFRNLKPRT